MKANKMPVIVWDVDDVLNNLMHSWFEQRWLISHPECSLRYGDIVENPPHQILGVSLNEYLESLDEFRLSGDYQLLIPNQEILIWFKKFGNRFRHMALTTTPLRSAPISAAWVMHYFGEWIRCFSFVPSRREGEYLPHYDNDKVEFLAWWGRADILVDDSIAHVKAFQSMGLRAILVPQPWNDSHLTIAQTLDLLLSSAQGVES